LHRSLPAASRIASLTVDGERSRYVIRSRCTSSRRSRRRNSNCGRQESGVRRQESELSSRFDLIHCARAGTNSELLIACAC
jgi:hypothetical protein